MNNIWLAFITGITTGGLSCLAVQGGLLTSSLASHEEHKEKRLVLIFLASKLLAYTVLGFLLGAVGEVFSISPRLQGFMQIFAGLFMLVTAARLLNLHPIFRNFVIQPPKWAYRLSKNASQNESLFAPAILGTLTVLIPCGITQAVMVTALASGNALAGAGIMFAFTLGTTPVFLSLGIAAMKLMQRKSFVYITSGVIAVLGILSINTGQILRGSVHTLQNYYKTLVTSQPSSISAQIADINNDGFQEATINVTNRGYSSSVNTLKTGVPVKLSLIADNATGCTRAFTIPSLGISKILPQNGTETLEFTPTKAGKLTYTCSMGMYTGAFQVTL